MRCVLYYPQEIGRNINEILRIIKALQISDEFNVAIPANWPYNSIMNSNVLLKAPKTVSEAQKRLEDAKSQGYSCYDFWFCVKSL